MSYIFICPPLPFISSVSVCISVLACALFLQHFRALQCLGVRGFTYVLNIQSSFTYTPKICFLHFTNLVQYRESKVPRFLSL
ncbi:hypothetical protein XELAEV_18018455mg [Xenopus laevis]|uniref:Uncharacterized protein n=1 Tax=Xenopus laevis TaxID=8355 RepID=A0A974DDI8_XENLA|nr:hypothetical protein XELAEV_18018455mg [Xenopus laevis]